MKKPNQARQRPSARDSMLEIAKLVGDKQAIKEVSELTEEGAEQMMRLAKEVAPLFRRANEQSLPHRKRNKRPATKKTR
jgi:hypothetical protein